MRLSLARPVLRGLPVGLAIALVVLAVPGRLLGASTVWLAQFTIDDSHPNAKVTSDLGIAYADYRLPRVPGDAGCIEASPDSRGFLHATLNRKVDDAGTRCNTAGSDRQYRIRLTSAPNACERLVSAYSSNVVVGPQVGECEVLSNVNPRIRVDDLFKRGAQSTPLKFLLDKSGINGLGYEVVALSNVPMQAPHPNSRILIYDGQAMLNEFGIGKPKFVGEAFDLGLRVVFDRFAQ